MRYGYFDNNRWEYVIDRVDVPVPWTNYIGLKDFYGVFDHTAAGYVLYGSSEYHRISRFRPNGPMEGPGHYVYIRDEDTGEYWSISWQPVGKPKEHCSFLCNFLHHNLITKIGTARQGFDTCRAVFLCGEVL